MPATPIDAHREMTTLLSPDISPVISATPTHRWYPAGGASANPVAVRSRRHTTPLHRLTPFPRPGVSPHAPSPPLRPRSRRLWSGRPLPPPRRPRRARPGEGEVAPVHRLRRAQGDGHRRRGLLL